MTAVVKSPQDEFTWSETDEPHATRRKLILNKYPEIKSLFVKEPLTFWCILGIVSAQVAIAYFMRDASWPWIIAAAWIVGGTFNHSLQLAVHEASHNLVFESETANKISCLLANLPTGLPSSITFQRYHMDHHQFQGVDAMDTDIPSSFEVSFFRGTILKLLWVFMQPFFYGFRPLIIKPKGMSKWELINYLVQWPFDFAIFYFFGAKSLAYLILGTFLGLGLHPCAGHFIAEHYQFIKGQETYSYYGICNFFNFNVGYHQEHHDLPRVPWTKLPLVKKMAPEFYENEPFYTSYLAVFWRYLTDPTIGPASRIKRRMPQKSE